VQTACPSENRLADYVDRRLAAGDVEHVERHLDGCPVCMALLAGLAEPTETRGGSSALAHLDEGATLDRYVVKRRLGAGAMGVVFEAFDPELERKVAIKVVSTTAGRVRDRDRTRMQREAQAMARLSHPNLVPVLAVGTRGDDLYLVMELVQGETLRAWVNAAPRPWRAIVRAYVAAGRGLAAAHAAGVVHRDFKPDNVLVGESPSGVRAAEQGAPVDDGDGTRVAERLRVIDFGLARIVAHPTFDVGESIETYVGERVTGSGSRPDDDRTGAGTILGTPAYMPPEQLLDASVDARADQFALAVSVWEGLFGARPFAGQTLASLVDAVEQRRVRRPRGGPRVPLGLRRALMRALSADPADRFADMTAFVDALERSLGRIAKSVAIGVAIGATALAAFVLAGGDDKPCTAEDAPRWDASARARVQEAFARADDGISTSAESVIAALDGRVGAWHDAYAQTCVSQPDGDASDAARTCLDVRRFELDAAIELIATSEVDVLARALSMVAGLPAVEPCARSAPQLARADPKALVDEARALREELAAARALGEAGRFAEAMAVAQPVLDRAGAIGHTAVHAEAAVRVGQYHVDLGDPIAALPVLEAAFFEAREIGHDEIATEASVALVLTVGGKLGRIDEVAPWIAHAEAALNRWGTLELEAQLAKAQSGIAMRADDHEAAIAHATRAVELWRERGDLDDPRYATAIDALGTAYHYAKQYDDALEHLERALAIRERLYGDRHPHVGYSLTNIALVLIEQGLAEQAIHYNEWVIDINRAALGPDHVFTAVAHNNLGAVWGKLEEPAAATEQFELALPGFARLGDDHPDHAMVLTNIGQGAMEAGDPVRAAEALERALAIRERRHGLEHPDTLACVALLGTVSAAIGAHGRAVASIERALAGKSPPKGYAAADLLHLRAVLVRSRFALGDREDALRELATLERDLAAVDGAPPRLVAEIAALRGA
jgi:tetratricopeptide (TPR) repeat protein